MCVCIMYVLPRGDQLLMIKRGPFGCTLYIIIKHHEYYTRAPVPLCNTTALVIMYNMYKKKKKGPRKSTDFLAILFFKSKFSNIFV